MDLTLSSSLYLRRSPLLLRSSNKFSPTQFPTLSPSLRFLPRLSAVSRRNPAVIASAVAVEKAEQERFPAGVRVTETKEPLSSVRLSVEVPPAVCQECYRKVVQEFSKQSKVPGFRPGKKIPESILVNFVGRQNVQGATIEAILKKTLPEAMSSVEGRALKDSVCIVTKFSEMDESFSLQNIFRWVILRSWIYLERQLQKMNRRVKRFHLPKEKVLTWIQKKVITSFPGSLTQYKEFDKVKQSHFHFKSRRHGNRKISEVSVLSLLLSVKSFSTEIYQS